MYRCAVTSNNSYYPVFFVMDDLCIGIDYRYPGHLNVITADENDFKIEEETQNDHGDRKAFLVKALNWWGYLRMGHD